MYVVCTHTVQIMCIHMRVPVCLSLCADILHHLSTFETPTPTLLSPTVIDPKTDPTFYATTTFDLSLFPLLLGVVASAPLVAAGFAISRSESRVI